MISQTSTLVAVGNNGRLMYAADSKGNTIPDFSGVGYMNGEANIPFIPIVKTVNAIAGDNKTNIQNAINDVAALPVNANGFRGAILFTAGTYNISDAINITASGIVLRGEGFDGLGTNFIATKKSKHTLINFKGNEGTSQISSSKKAITNNYLPIGAKELMVESGHSFIVGDKVFLHRIPNAAWINLIGMDVLSSIDTLATNWTASSYDM